MAITRGDVLMWRDLKARGLLPVDPAVLEVGEANWYGDVRPEDCPELAALEALTKVMDTWYLAKAFYRAMLGPGAKFTAIDANGSEGALRLDLNLPLQGPPSRSFHVVVNTGTLEHVFDQRQVWETVHDCCRAGGLMVHALPMHGWYQHGFFNYHPTIISDLCGANGYTVVHESYSAFAGGQDTMLHVALRKSTEDSPFRVPYQGRYVRGECTERR